MKIVERRDERGYVRKALLRDADGIDMFSIGIPLDPPDLGKLGLDALVLDRSRREDLRRELHNELSRRGLTTFETVQRAPREVGASVTTALRKAGLEPGQIERGAVAKTTRAVVQLYRMKSKEASI